MFESGTAEYWFNQWMLTIFMMSVFAFGFLTFLVLVIKTRNILDRYRLRFGFTTDIELKEIDEKDQMKKLRTLDRIEKNFKRRTFTD